MITRAVGDTWEFDTFLMSCRVIGRTVETAMLATVTEDALAAGATRLAGWFLPTKKNAPAQAIYADHGFKKTEESDDGTRWELDLATSPVEAPEWIQRDRP
jgi:predicted enzyme involved in methoxymalonyl-ACP biosynthesis